MPDWKEFEKLAEKIFKELHTFAKVKHNDKIFGYDTQKERQIDVSIRWKSGKDAYLTIVQTKDEDRPADITKVGEFLSVINDVQATGGILVCKSGFTKDAHVYARNVGISLLNLHDALSTKWSHKLTIPILWNELEPIVNVNGGVYLEAGDTVPTKDPLGPPMTASDEHSRIDPLSTFQKFWNNSEANKTPGVTHHVQSDQPLKLIVRDSKGKIQLRPVQEFSITYTVQLKSWLGTFEPSECRGIIDYLDNKSFTASHLPLSEIPIKRNEKWVSIENPSEVIKNTRGTIVSTTNVARVNMLGIEETTFKLSGK